MRTEQANPRHTNSNLISLNAKSTVVQPSSGSVDNGGVSEGVNAGDSEDERRGGEDDEKAKRETSEKVIDSGVVREGNVRAMCEDNKPNAPSSTCPWAFSASSWSYPASTATAAAFDGREESEKGRKTKLSLIAPRTRCHPCLPPLIPPFRYSMVEEGVYRGGYPSLKNLRFLERLCLRTIISLIPEYGGVPTCDLSEFCTDLGIRHVTYQVNKYDDGFSHTTQLVSTILTQIINPHNHPLFIHCRDGAHNTGIVMMCLRRLQNWNLQAIYDEFIRYTKSNLISFEEKQFVESFHVTVAIPPLIPPWLWDGKRRSKHPCIQLALVNHVVDSSSCQSSPKVGAVSTTTATAAAVAGVMDSPSASVAMENTGSNWMMSRSSSMDQYHYHPRNTTADDCIDCLQPLPALAAESGVMMTHRDITGRGSSRDEEDARGMSLQLAALDVHGIGTRHEPVDGRE